MNLRDWREAEGLTQEQAAARIGISQGTLSRYESGKQEPSMATVRRIKAATDGKVTAEDWPVEREG